MTERQHDNRLFAVAVNRNRDPILAVLERVLPETGLVLEIASGSGEHAAYFSPKFPHLTWQPSDVDPEARKSISAWAKATEPPFAPPLALDVCDAAWPVTSAAAVVCINMIHISPWESCLGLMAGAGRILEPGGPLYLYGPYTIGRRHYAESNAAFDESLRRRNPAWGVRDVDEVTEAAARQGLEFCEMVEMPANNRSLIFKKSAE